MQYPLSASRREAVLELLAEAAGWLPSITSEEPVGHEWAPVTRITLDRPVPAFGSTVIVKTRRVDGEGHGGPFHLRREQVGLRLGWPSGVTPRLLAADDRAGVVISSDLGRWPNLETVLLGHDRDQATAALIDLGRAVGRLHGTTLGMAAVYRDDLATLGTEPGDQSRLGDWDGVNRWAEVEVRATLAGTACLFPALAGWFSRLGDAMARRWPDATSPTPPLFPAFGGTTMVAASGSTGA